MNTLQETQEAEILYTIKLYKELKPLHNFDRSCNGACDLENKLVTFKQLADSHDHDKDGCITCELVFEINEALK